ncbi:T/G mismatch-specific endonuclease [Alteromonadaceae bacterium 2753L.S.0a.02]|nr:T/G mismatch-specific endonuclease [Alteromonadaceae bacterium 2753L.S.0a.02]
MSDTLTKTQRSERMGRIKHKDTKPEMKVRKLVHGMGYRYRLHKVNLPGKPDLVFSSRKKIIFVHGCFWHRHPDPCCKLARLPKSKIDFWLPKLEGNRKRDEENLRRLNASGWDVLVVWECEIKDKERLKAHIKEFLE